jgi:hypothetical protein
MAMLLTVFGPGPAHATEESNKVAARALGTDGVEAYQAGDYARATKQLESAYAVLRVPSLGLWSARALVKVGKLVEAAERYLEASQLPVDSGGAEQVQEAAVRDAERERQELLPRIPALTIHVETATPDAATCTLDGAQLAAETLGEATPVNPGTRRVTCAVSGKQQKKVLTLAEGAQETIVLTFAPEASGPVDARSGAASPEDQGAGQGNTQRILGWTAIGVGTAGLAVGGVLAILAADKMSGLNCTDTVCNEPQDELDAYNGLRVPSTVSLVAGGVLAATGITLLLTAPKTHESASLNPSLSAYVTGSGVGLRGRF